MVYVDDMYKSEIGKFGRMKMSHMVADSGAELLEMATRIGVDHKWIQHAGTAREHFDISLSKRAAAVAAGAQEITWKQTGEFILNRAKPMAMSKVQIVKKKCCGKVFAACCEPDCYTDPDWTRQIRIYVQQGHKVDFVDTAPLETCTCVKPEQPKQLNLFAV